MSGRRKQRTGWWCNISYKPDVSEVCPWNVGVYHGDSYQWSEGAVSFEEALRMSDFIVVHHAEGVGLYWKDYYRRKEIA